MLSEMQTRLREEYDRMNTVVLIAFSQCGDMLSYGLLENVTRKNCMSVEDAIEDMDWGN